MTVMPLTPGHAEEIAAVEALCFTDPWSLQSVQSELQNPVSQYFGVVLESCLAAYGGIQIVLDEGYITNIATNPAFRRRGAAGAVLRHILADARARGLVFVTLEVRESNAPARALYQKHGFEEAGLRRAFYNKPREDAVILTKVLADGKPGGTEIVTRGNDAP